MKERMARKVCGPLKISMIGPFFGTYIFGLMWDLTEFSGRHNMKGDTMEFLGRIASGMFGKRLTYKGLIG